MRKDVIVKQEEYKECGASCLLSIIKYYGGNISIDKLLKLTNTNHLGTNFYNIKVAANEIGLNAKGYKVNDVKLLIDYEKPFICQTNNNNYLHFVVVYKIKDNKILVMDPAIGLINMDINSFNTIWTKNIMTFEKIKELPKYSEKNYIIEVIKQCINNNKKIIINLVLLSLISTIFTTIYSYNFQVLVDNLYTNDFNILIIIIVFLIILFQKNIVNYLRFNLLNYLNQKLDLSIITSTLKRIIYLPFNYYKNKTTGDMISRVNDLFYIKNYISKFIIAIFLDTLVFITCLIILFKINYIMSIMLLLIVLVYIVLFLTYKPSIKRITNVSQENNAILNSFLVESISGYETIKGLSLETTFLKKLNHLYIKSSNINFNFNKIMNSYELYNQLFEGLILLFITYVGMNNILKDNMTIGYLITFNSISMYLLNSTKSILELYKDYYYTKNSIKRINNLINVQIDKLDKTTNLKVLGNIEFKNTTYSYNNRDNVLNRLNIKIKHRDRVLLLGPSGSGKSTILKLLYRYYEINRESIFINNIDINDYTLKDIRNNISYISQNEVLYTDTIKNNIILEREINDIEYLNICKLTYVNDVIKNSNEGHNLLLEENGINLSGGQRQRIILARALLKTSSIVLIDEGLNEIDIKLERQILNNIFNYYKDRTFIIISHRLNNSDLFNNIIKLESRNTNEF